MSQSFTWTLQTEQTTSLPDLGSPVESQPTRRDARSLQFERGMKFANVPSGRADFVSHNGERVRHVNSLVSIEQRPSDKSGNSGVINIRDSIVGLNMSSVSSSLPSDSDSHITSGVGTVVSEMVSDDAFRSNTFVSGTEDLENSEIPATKTLLYSKANRFLHRMYKLSASVNLTNYQSSSAGARLSDAEYSLSRTGSSDPDYPFIAGSGSYVNATINDPAEFVIDVPDRGKIRDVKVWVEFIHDIRGGRGMITGSNPYIVSGSGDSGSFEKHGLQNVQLALRSPNTNFKHARPLWNSEQMTGQIYTVVGSDFTTGGWPPPKIFDNSYLLWSGHRTEETLGATLTHRTSSIPDAFFDMNQSVTASCVQTVIDFDSKGLIHAVCRQTSTAKPHYLTQITGTINFYSHGRISGSDETDSGDSVDIIVDKNDIPHTFFNTTYIGDSSTKALVRSYRDSNLAWNYDYVDISGTFTSFSSKVDARNNVRIVAACAKNSNEYGYDVVHYDFVSSSWRRNIVDQIGYATSHNASLAIDSQDHSHVLYLRRYDNKLMHAYSVNDLFNSWSYEVVADYADESGIAYSSGRGAKICIGSDDVIRVVYLSGAFLLYAASGSSGWTRTVIDSGSIGVAGTHVKDVSMDLDADNNVYVSFSTTSSIGSYFHLAYINELGSSYTTIGSSSMGTYGTFNSVAYDKTNNKVAVMCAASSTNYVRYVQQTSSADAMYFEYDADIDMRTVFSDSSKVPNPRSLFDSQGKSRIYSLVNGSYRSPLSASYSLFKYTDLRPFYKQTQFLTGANFPWMIDDRIPPGDLFIRTYKSLTGSLNMWIPNGWLTDGLNEFPTTGSQLGPQDIRSAYPLLDDVYERKIFYETPSAGRSAYAMRDTGTEIVGFRPGLRGTEASGKWKLLIGMCPSGSSTVPDKRAGVWFRQWRLELVIDQHEDSRSPYPSRDRLYNKPTQCLENGRRVIDLVSGSMSWDIGVNEVFIKRPEDYGRTIGITKSTSSQDSFAVFSKLTGSIEDSDSFLNNEFGTPHIPLAYGSSSIDAFTIEEIEISKRVTDEVLRKNTLIPQDNTMKSYLVRVGYTKTTADAMLEKITELYSGSSV